MATPGCNKQPGNQSQAGAQPSTAPASNDQPAPAAGNGAMLYAQANCAMCHGADLSGARMGPPLLGLEQYWDAAGLTSYLRDPLSCAPSDERLKKLGAKYPATMPATAMSEEDLQQLVTWLLTQ